MQSSFNLNVMSFLTVKQWMSLPFLSFQCHQFPSFNCASNNFAFIKLAEYTGAQYLGNKCQICSVRIACGSMVQFHYTQYT